MKVRRLVAAIALGSVFFAFNSSPAESQEIVKLKLGHTQQTTHYFQRTALSFASKVAKYSDGKILVDVFPTSQLGSDRSLVEGLRLGTVQLYEGTTAVFSQFIPEFMVFMLPYAIKDVHHAQKVWDQVLSQKISEKVDKAGFRILSFLEGGERGAACKKPIMQLDDLKGLRIRTMESKVYMEAYKALGAIATPIPFSELIGALSQGVVDGGDYTHATWLNSKSYQVAPFFSRINIVRGPSALAISLDVWKKLSKELREATQKAADEAANEQIQSLENDIRQYENNAREAKFPFAYTFPDLTEFREAVKPVYGQFEKEVGKGTIEKILEIQ